MENNSNPTHTESGQTNPSIIDAKQAIPKKTPLTFLPWILGAAVLFTAGYITARVISPETSDRSKTPSADILPTGKLPVISGTVSPIVQLSRKVIYILGGANSTQLRLKDLVADTDILLVDAPDRNKSFLLFTLEWKDRDIVVYQLCTRLTPGEKSNYTCRLLERNLSTGEEKPLAERTSFLNVNDYPVEGEFGKFTFSPDQKTLAYFASSGGTGQKSGYNLFVKKLPDGEPVKLDTFIATGGRGGTYDDDVYLGFSPDGTKLLAVNTSVLPVNETDNQSSLRIYDLNSNSVTWQATGNSFVTFGRFINNQEIIAKFIADNQPFSGKIINLSDKSISDLISDNYFNFVIINEKIYATLRGQEETEELFAAKGDLATGKLVRKIPNASVKSPVSGQSGKIMIENIGICDVQVEECYGGNIKTAGYSIWDPETDAVTPLSLPEDTYALSVWMDD